MSKEYSNAAGDSQPQKITVQERIADAKRRLKEEKRDWTIMVYLAGDNNLEEEMVYALKSMFAIGSTNRCKVFALFDTGLDPITFDIPERAEIIRQPGFALLNAQVQSIGNEGPVAENLGLLAIKEQLQKKPSAGGVISVQSALEGFIVDSICKAPAHQYMLVLSGHGTGDAGDFLAARKRFSGLTIPDLKQTLLSVEEVFADEDAADVYSRMNILGMDSCQMSTAEVAYQVRDRAQFLVGAEGFESNTGWPYDRILDRLNRDLNSMPTSTESDIQRSRQLALSIVQEYTMFYASDYSLADVSTDLSALDLQELGKVVTPLVGQTGLVALLCWTLEEAMNQDRGNAPAPYLSQRQIQKEDRPPVLALRDVITLSHWESQGYKDEQNIDLSDFCRGLAQRCERINDRAASTLAYDIAAACKEVSGAVDGVPAQDLSGKPQGDLVVLSGYCGPEFQHSHGLSVFFPWARYTDAAGVDDFDHYRTLDFAWDTCWDEFLRAYTDATRRPVRKPGANLIAQAIPHESSLNRRDSLFIGDPVENIEINGLINGDTESQAKVREFKIEKGLLIVQSGTIINSDKTTEIVSGSRFEIEDSRILIEENGMQIFVDKPKQTLAIRHGRLSILAGKLKTGEDSFSVGDGRIDVRDGTHTTRGVTAISISGGSVDHRDGTHTTRDGTHTTRDGTHTTRDGTHTTRDGTHTTRDGTHTTRDGRILAVVGNQIVVRDGTHTTRDSSALTIENGVLTVRDGTHTTRDGTHTTRGGGMPTRISSMKNPPIQWMDCDLIEKTKSGARKTQSAKS